MNVNEQLNSLFSLSIKYNVSGVFKTSLSVENLNGKSLYFIISKGKEFIKSLLFYLQSYYNYR